MTETEYEKKTKEFKQKMAEYVYWLAKKERPKAVENLKLLINIMEYGMNKYN